MDMFRTGVACLGLIACAGLASATPFSVEAMLKNQSYGHVWIDPTERNAVVERRAPYDSASDYGLGGFTTRQLSKLWRIDIATGSKAVPLFEQADDVGYWAEGFSPSGRYLSVMALKAKILRAGLFDMISGRLRWLAGSPDMPFAQPGPLWLDDTHLLQVRMVRPQLPRLIDGTSGAADRTVQAWKAQASGKAASVSRLSTNDATAGPDGARELHLIDLRSGGDRLLWRGELVDLAASADRRFVAVVSHSDIRRPSPATPIGLDFQSRSRILTIIDLLANRSWQPCPGCDLAPNLLRWSAKRASLLVFARDRAASAWEHGELLRIDPARDRFVRLGTPALMPLIDKGDGGSGLFIHASWAGVVPLFYARTGADRGDWYAVGEHMARSLTAGLAAPSSALASSSDRGLEVLSGRQLWSLTADGRTTGQIDDVDAIGATTLDSYHFGGRGMVNMPPFAPPLLVRRQASGPPRLSNRQGHLVADLGPDATLLAVAPRSGRAIIVSRHASGSAEMVLFGLHDRPIVVDRINLHLDSLERARAIAIPANLPSGAPATHWFLLPPGTRSGRLPLVVIPYPGSMFGADRSPAPTPDRVFAETNGQLLAAHGFAVLYPSLPLGATDRDPVAHIATAVDAAVDAAIASGFADPDRIAIWGHSYGGYGALAVATRSRRYRAIVASAAASNLFGLYGSLVPRTDSDTANQYLTLPGVLERGQFGMGGTPWTAFDTYVRNSPFFAADRIVTPILLINGDLDFSPIGQAEGLFTALMRLDKDAELLRYRGENHLVASPANISDAIARVLAWLDDRLAPRPISTNAAARPRRRRRRSAPAHRAWS